MRWVDLQRDFYYTEQINGSVFQDNRKRKLRAN